MKNLLLSLLLLLVFCSISIGQSNSNSGPYSILDLEKIYIMTASQYKIYLNDNGFVDTKRKMAGFLFYRERSNEDLYLVRNQHEVTAGSVVLSTNYKARVDKFRNSLSLNGYTFQETVSGTDTYKKKGNIAQIEYEPDTERYHISLITFMTVESSNNTLNEDQPSRISNQRLSSNKVEIFSGPPQGSIPLKQGDIISFSTLGTVRFGAFAGNGNANGIDGFTSYNKVSGFRHGALLDRIDNGSWFLIGTNASYKIIDM